VEWRQRELKILYCGANPADRKIELINVDRESRAIDDAIGGSAFRLFPKLATRPADLPRLLAQERPAILHFGLHGIANDGVAGGPRRDLTGDSGGAGGLVLIDDRGDPTIVDAQKLRKILTDSGLRFRCLILNACHSEHVAEQLTACADHVVGMNAPISDLAAITYSKIFYQCLAQNQTYQTAHETAKRDLRGLRDSEDDVPVLIHRKGKLEDRPWPRKEWRVGWIARVVLSVALALAMVMALASGIGPYVGEMRLALMSQRAKVVRLTPSPRLRVALIDEETVVALKGTRVDDRELGAFGTSWRTLFARAIDQLAAGGAAVIVFDVAFEEEPKETSKHDLAATSALAKSIENAKNTKIVLPALERDERSGLPRLASAVLHAQIPAGSDATCKIAHPCMSAPAKGPAVPMLPLVLDDEKAESAPVFALSLCAYSLAEGATPSWSAATGEVYLSRARAKPISYSGLEADPDVADCKSGSASLLTVQRVLAPFAADLVRSNDRVLPFETLVGTNTDLPLEWDVKDKIVLIGQRDIGRDRFLDQAEPDGKPLWGVSAHAAAIDALFMGTDGLMSFIRPEWQMLWIAALCLLALGIRLRLPPLTAWLQPGALALVALTDVAVGLIAARNGFVVDIGNHVIALVLAYLVAGRLRPKRQSSSI
jgi:CHASE2 domain-containing sensor protein